MAGEETFLSRWSRLKQDVKREEPEPANPPEAPAAQPPAPAPDLPPVESLTFDSDYRAFLQPNVDPDLKRAALKKLFRDPHFHFDQMDKLDTYIDDYTIEDPIPEAMLKTLDHARHILFDEKKAAAEKTAAQEAADAPEAKPQGNDGHPGQDA